MAVTNTIRKRHYSNWAGYMEIDILFDITGTINDAFDLLTVDIKVVSAVYNDSGLSVGYGFVNIGGISWLLPERAQAFSRDYTYLYDWDSSYNQLRGIYSGISPSFDDRLIWGYGASDDPAPAQVERFLGIQVGQSKRFTRPITSEDFDAEGNLKDIQLVSGFSRYINANPVDPQWPDSWVICRTGPSFELSFDDFDFFPWAIRKTTWKSCNREGGSLRIRKNGAWRDCRNTISPTGPNNKGKIRKSGLWVTSPIAGEDG